MPDLATLNTSTAPRLPVRSATCLSISPWVADETLSQRPFRDATHLHTALCATMRAATPDRQLALIRAHPDLAGRLARQNALTAESTREQAGAGLNRLTDDELAEFQRLNTATSRVSVSRSSSARASTPSRRSSPRCGTRLPNTTETEFTTALGEIEKIAQLRLNDLLEKTI